MNISTILDLIDLGLIALPEFQRGYVWNRDQVRSLMQSLYRRYPVGTLLVWNTCSEGAHARGDGKMAPGVVKLLLDGQQRMTSLCGIVRGAAPEFSTATRRPSPGCTSISNARSSPSTARVIQQAVLTPPTTYRAIVAGPAT